MMLLFFVQYAEPTNEKLKLFVIKKKCCFFPLLLSEESLQLIKRKNIKNFKNYNGGFFFPFKTIKL